MFRFSTRKAYEEELSRYASLCCWDPDCNGGIEVDEFEYDELMDEYIKFCEVSGSGQ